VIPTGGNRIQIPQGVTNRISSTYPGINNLQFGGSGTFITGFNISSFVTEQSFIQNLGGTSTLFDLDAGVFTTNSTFSAHRQVYFNWDSLGAIKGFALVGINSLDCEECGPLVLEGNQRFFIAGTVFDPGTASFTLVSIIGDNVVRGNIAEGEWLVRSGQSALFIDPNIGADSRISIDMVLVDLEAGGEFFETGVTGDISGIADNTSNGTVNSVVTNSLGILVTTAAPHGLVVNQEVTLTTGISAYNIPAIILDTPNTNEFILSTPFITNTSGTWIANSVTVTTVSPHGLSDSQTLLIEDQPDYNGGARIYLASGSVFSINRNFVGVAGVVGTYNTGSLTQTDPRITVSQVEGVPDSQIIFNFAVTGGADLTTINTTDVFQDINFTNATFTIIGTERFTLINPINGEFRYEGKEDITLSVNGFGSLTKTAQGKLFEFVPAVNGAELSASIAPSPVEVSLVLASTPFAGVIAMSSGDTIKMKIRNTEDADDATVQGFSFIGKV